MVLAIRGTDKSTFIALVELLYSEKVGKSWKDLEDHSLPKFKDLAGESDRMAYPGSAWPA